MNNFIVYKHTSPNGKVYIGLTSQNPNRRWRKNGEGYKRNIHFWNSIKKYGWDNFKHEILFSNLSKEEAEKMEIEQIHLYNSTNNKFGFNHSLGGESGSYGYKFSKEQKEKLCKIRKGKNNPMYGKHHTKETIEKDRNAHKKENLSKETIYKMSIAKKGKKRTNESINKQIETTSKKVICIETGIIYMNAREASEKNNIDKSCISKVCRKERKTAGKLHWKYYDD